MVVGYRQDMQDAIAQQLSRAVWVEKDRRTEENRSGKIQNVKNARNTKIQIKRSRVERGTVFTRQLGSVTGGN